jgi:hypothetical protein
MFTFASTSDKVLSIILENQDMPIQELTTAIRSRLKLSQWEIDSAFADLSRQGLIATLYADGTLCALAPQPYAHSRLKTKREMKTFSLKWDLVKISLGFVSGFVSAWLLK